MAPPHTGPRERPTRHGRGIGEHRHPGFFGKMIFHDFFGVRTPFRLFSEWLNKKRHERRLSHENKAVQNVIDTQHEGQREPIFRAMRRFREGPEGFGKAERATYNTIASTYERIAKVKSGEEDEKYLRPVDKEGFYTKMIRADFKMLTADEFEILGTMIKDRDKIREASSKATKLRLADRRAEAEEIEASIVGPARELEQQIERWEYQRKLFTRFEKQANAFRDYMFGNRKTRELMYTGPSGVVGPSRER